MTIIVKASIKSNFETGDKPTQADFVELIDESIPNWFEDWKIQIDAATVGVVEVVSTASVTTRPIGSVGAQLLSVATTASANDIVGGGGTVVAVSGGEGLTGGSITVSGALALDVSNLTELSDPANNDVLALYDITAAGHRKITTKNFMKAVDDLTELSVEPDGAADFIAVYDTTGSETKKITRDNYLNSGAVGLQILSVETTASATDIVGFGGAAQATQAAIEAETNENTYIPPDLLKHSPGVAKVWGQFDGGAAGPITPDVDYNIVDVTDNGTGDYTINIDTDFSSANFAFGGAARPASDGSSLVVSVEFGSTLAAGTFQIQLNDVNGTRGDSDPVNVWAFGDQ